MILVIENDPLLRTVLQAALTCGGFVCEVATDSIDALERLRNTTYETVILDLMLPRLSGFEILRFLRSRTEAANSRVILLTANSSASLSDFAGQKPVCTLMEKPLELSDLLATLRRCIPATVA